MRRNTGRARRYPPARPVTPLTGTEAAELILAVLASPFAPPEPGPAPFRGPRPSDKSLCPACGWAGRGNVTCLRCEGAMIQMPRSWRPGRAGSRTRVWDVRAHRNRFVYVPDVVRQLGVRGLPPRNRYWWGNPDPVHKAITARGNRQRARRRRNRKPGV